MKAVVPFSLMSDLTPPPALDKSVLSDAGRTREALDRGADPNAPIPYVEGTTTPLTWVCRHGSRELTRLLLAAGAETRVSRGHVFGTPLHEAVMRDDPVLVELLAEADPECLTTGEHFGLTPIELAVKEACTRSLETLLALGVGVDSVRIHIAMGGGLVRLAVEASPDPVGVLEVLRDHGADLDSRSIQNATALHNCALFGEERGLAWLIDNGADIEARDNYSRTPLMCAIISFAGPGGAEQLIAAGADVNAADETGHTPLSAAVQSGRELALVRQLIAAGADVDATDLYGLTPLAIALSRSNLDTAAELIDAGASVEKPAAVVGAIMSIRQAIENEGEDALMARIEARERARSVDAAASSLSGIASPAL